MSNFQPDNGENADLSLDKYIAQLIDYKNKATKIFEMGGTKSYTTYVLSSLQYAIDVAQEKNVISDTEKKAVLESAKNLTNSALIFHTKFTQTREDIVSTTNSQQDYKSPRSKAGLGK